MSRVLGIDIGGSGMKAAIVDTDTGELVSDKHRIPTPRPATPATMVPVVAELTRHFDWSGLVGVGFPGVIQAGVVKSAANLDEEWIDIDSDALFSEASSCDVTLMNDADAAGIAEMRFGAGVGASGVVIMLTLGTGIGTAIFVDGKLLPNTEFGHLMIDGKPAEHRASSRVKEEDDLSYKKWGRELEIYMCEMERLFWPDMFILGGGISKSFEKFEKHLDDVRSRVVPAKHFNRAGILGAAMIPEFVR